MIPEDCRRFTLPNHMTQAFQVMNELRQHEQLCDIVLSVDGQHFSAHKVVLAGCSPYLCAMFTNGMMETDKNVIEIQGVDPSSMEILLDLMYKGVVEITTENVQALLQGASLLNLLSVRHACCQFLQQHLHPANCLGIHYIADMFSCVELEAATRQYVYQHFLQVIQHEEFLQLANDRLIELLKSDQLQVNCERQVFEAALTWVEVDPAERLNIACDIIRNIRLVLLDRSYIEEFVSQTSMVRDCAQCQCYVATAVQMKNEGDKFTRVTKRALPQGIFIVGGRNGSDSQLKSMERYDVIHDEWHTLSPMSTARTAVSAGTVDGVLYAVGGECALAELHDETMYLATMEAYDPVLDVWNPCAEMKVPRSFIAVVTLSGYLYAIGGEDRNNSFNVVEQYNPKQDTWTFVTHMRQKRAGAGAAVCDGKIYVAGGYDKSFRTDRASMECYDPTTAEWNFVAEMECARSGLSLVAVDHFLYAVGGRSRYHQYYDVGECYNTLTHQWTSIVPMNTPRGWPAYVVINKKIYVMGGFDGSHRLRSIEMYDPELNTWKYLCNMNVSRAGGAAAVI